MNKDFRFILKSFLLWRIFLFFPLVVAPYFISTRLGFISPISLWANFDGVHYLSIARGGYDMQAAFFPLYPLLTKLLAEIFGGNYFLSAFLISNFSFLFAAYYLYKLVKDDFSGRVAKWVTLFLLIFPTSFFFVSIYSESLFLLLLVLTFYFAKKRKWWYSSLLGILLSATRLVGVLILPALLWEAFLVYKKNIIKALSQSWSLFLIPIGVLSYALFNLRKWGDALYFIKAHSQLSNSRSVDSIILFPQTIFRYSKILLSLSMTQFEWWIALLEVSTFFAVFFLIYLAYKKVKSSYLIFSALTFLLPISSGTFSGLPRYVLILFPIYVALATLKDTRIKISIAVLFAILLFIFIMYFSRGYFIA